MQDAPRFIGRRYTNEEKAELRRIVENEAAKGTEKVGGELEKTASEIESIHFANVIMEVWLRSRNIEFEVVIPERVHFLPASKFEELDTNPSTLGFYRTSTDAVFINHSKLPSRAGLLSLLVHEFLHRAHDASVSRKLAASEEGEIFSARSGYRIISPWKKKSARFEGLNEIVLVYCQIQILNDAASFLEDKAKIYTSEWQNFSLYPYKQYANVLEVIVKKISTGGVDSEHEVYEKLIQGQFSNTMLVLKDIEYAFGKDSLRVLSYLRAFEGQQREQIDSLVTEYFFEERDEVRKAIATNIFELVKAFTGDTK